MSFSWVGAALCGAFTAPTQCRLETSIFCCSKIKQTSPFDNVLDYQKKSLAKKFLPNRKVITFVENEGCEYPRRPNRVASNCLSERWLQEVWKTVYCLANLNNSAVCSCSTRSSRKRSMTVHKVVAQ